MHALKCIFLWHLSWKKLINNSSKKLYRLKLTVSSCETNCPLITLTLWFNVSTQSNLCLNMSTCMTGKLHTSARLKEVKNKHTWRELRTWWMLTRWRSLCARWWTSRSLCCVGTGAGSLGTRWTLRSRWGYPHKELRRRESKDLNQ